MTTAFGSIRRIFSALEKTFMPGRKSAMESAPAAMFLIIAVGLGPPAKMPRSMSFPGGSVGAVCAATFSSMVAPKIFAAGSNDRAGEEIGSIAVAAPTRLN